VWVVHTRRVSTSVVHSTGGNASGGGNGMSRRFLRKDNIDRNAHRSCDHIGAAAPRAAVVANCMYASVFGSVVACMSD